MRSRWIKKVHECQQPIAGRRGLGSIWRCRCGKRWELTSKRVDGIREYVRWSALS